MPTNVLAELMAAAVEQTAETSLASPPQQKRAANGHKQHKSLVAAPHAQSVPHKSTIASAPSCRREAEEPPEVAYDEEELEFQIGSAAIKPDDDDDFDMDDTLCSTPLPDVTPRPAEEQTEASSQAEKLEDEARQLRAAAEEARLRGEAQMAVSAAEEARLRSERIQAEMTSALKSVTESVFGDAPQTYGEISAKSEVEKADDKAAAMRGAKAIIVENDDEEEDLQEADPPPEAKTKEPESPPERKILREQKLMNQFDAATAAADASRAAAKKRGGSPVGSKADMRLNTILYDEASAQLSEVDFSQELQGVVIEKWDSSASIVHRLLPALRPKLKTATLRTQRDRIFAIAKVPMNHSVLHERMLFSIYKLLTGDATCPARLGPHWEVIGFQGEDPATDLRGVGMLSLLQVLHFATRRASLLLQIYQLSRGVNDFPFMTVSVNISQLALQALRAGALHSHCNRNKSELYEVFHSFYEALFLYMYSAWKFRSLTITDFGPLKNEMADVSLKKPAMLLKKLDQYGAKANTSGQRDNFHSLVQ